MSDESNEQPRVDDATVVRALESAREARGRARAPFSGFRVGAAVVVEGGDIFAGCNVESASYGLTLCAERNALSSMVAAIGEARVDHVVITTGADEPTPPCGACRQWLAELAPDAIVVSEAAGGRTARWTVAELLPGPFLGGSLRS